MRELREDEVTFSLEIEPEETPIRGNVLASDDDEEDRKAECEVLRQLERGNPWAWCSVIVLAVYTLPGGEELWGWDCLGGCSYADEADFRKGGYFEDMKAEALADLQRRIEALIERGRFLAAHFSAL